MTVFCSILYRSTNYEKLVDLKKYDLYFYSSTATIVCSRNAVRESSHISFFCGWDPFCEVVRRPENTHRELSGLLEWPVGLCLRLRDHRTSPLRLSDHWISSLRLSDQQISAFNSKLQTLYCLFKSHADLWISFSSTYFSVYGWLSELTYFRLFLPEICWSYLQTEKSVILSPGNKLYSRHHILYFSFLWKQLCWCYLSTALNQLSLSSPAKLVYYIRSIQMIAVFTNRFYFRIPYLRLFLTMDTYNLDVLCLSYFLQF